MRAGTPITIVSQRLGHASPLVTMGVYSHCLPSDQADAAAMFRRLLAPAETESTSGRLQSEPIPLME